MQLATVRGIPPWELAERSAEWSILKMVDDLRRLVHPY